MATIQDESQLEELPDPIRTITLENFETAQAKCDRDEERIKKIRDRQMERLCNEGHLDICELNAS